MKRAPMSAVANCSIGCEAGHRRALAERQLGARRVAWQVGCRFKPHRDYGRVALELAGWGRLEVTCMAKARNRREGSEESSGTILPQTRRRSFPSNGLMQSRRLASTAAALVAALIFAAPGAHAQTAPVPATAPASPTSVTWQATAGYGWFALRDIARTSTPVDASPVEWRGTGLAIDATHARATAARLHRFDKQKYDRLTRKGFNFEI
jgi:hypothetical protein